MSKDFATKFKTKSWGPASEQAHGLARAHCAEYGWQINHFVEAAVLAAVVRERSDKRLNLREIRVEAFGESVIEENGDTTSDA